jgi:hypothetical protein
MGYWGWRPLVCGVFFSVWIAGCNIVAETTSGAAPTAFPSVTLTVGRIIPFSTASPAQPAAVRPDTTISAPEPSCYADRSGGILCLGVIENRGASALALDEAFITVRLTAGGQIIERRARFEQRWAVPGGIAPYRAAFSAPPDHGFSPQIEIALPLLDAAPPASVRLTPLNARALWDGGRYQVSAALRNDDAKIGLIRRVVITLRDQSGRVIGYRVIAPEAIQLAPGDSLPLRVEIVPLADIPARTPPPRIDIYAEAELLAPD